MEFASFPKNLAYNIKTLSGFSKTTVKLTPDRTGNINAGETIKVQLPANTIIDLRTFVYTSIYVCITIYSIYVYITIYSIYMYTSL